MGLISSAAFPSLYVVDFCAWLTRYYTNEVLPAVLSHLPLKDMDPKLAYGAIAAWLINKIYEAFFSSHKELVKEAQRLTIAVVELKAEIKSLNEKISEIPAMRKDLNSIGGKVRDLQKLLPKEQ